MSGVAIKEEGPALKKQKTTETFTVAAASFLEKVRLDRRIACRGDSVASDTPPLMSAAAPWLAFHTAYNKEMAMYKKLKDLQGALAKAEESEKQSTATVRSLITEIHGDKRDTAVVIAASESKLRDLANAAYDASTRTRELSNQVEIARQEIEASRGAMINTTDVAWSYFADAAARMHCAVHSARLDFVAPKKIQ